MVRTHCPSISKFRLGFSFPSFGSGGASFGDILWAFSSVTFEVFLSAFEISFSSHPFFFLGGEVWLGPSVFSPALGSVDSSLGSGKLLSSVFAWGVSCSASFLLCMWFRQNLGISSLRRSLWWSAGCSDPGTFCWCCGTLSLPCRSLRPISLWALGRGFLFCLSFLRLRLSFYGCDWFPLCSVFYWLLPEWFSSVLQFFAAFFFFSCECMLGAWWRFPFWPLASSHSPFAALLLLFKYLCLLLLVSLFDFLNDCRVAFFSGTCPSGCSVPICMAVMFEESLFVLS